MKDSFLALLGFSFQSERQMGTVSRYTAKGPIAAHARKKMTAGEGRESSKVLGNNK